MQTYSLCKKIHPVLGMMSAVNFLMTKVGVTQKDIGKVTALDLRLVGCHIIQNLKVNVECFLSLGVHLLGKMIADLPTLLGVFSLFTRWKNSSESQDFGEQNKFKGYRLLLRNEKDLNLVARMLILVDLVAYFFSSFFFWFFQGGCWRPYNCLVVIFSFITLDMVHHCFSHCSQTIPFKTCFRFRRAVNSGPFSRFP